MTRRDFILISEVLETCMPSATYPAHPLTTWKEIVREFARRLSSTNPNFDAGRFKKACGLEE